MPALQAPAEHKDTRSEVGQKAGCPRAPIHPASTAISITDRSTRALQTCWQPKSPGSPAAQPVGIHCVLTVAAAGRASLAADTLGIALCGEGPEGGTWSWVIQQLCSLPAKP